MAAWPHQRRGASAYARKNGLPARVLRWRLRLTSFEDPAGIGWAPGYFESSWRIRACADGKACRPFFRTYAARWPHRAVALMWPRRRCGPAHACKLLRDDRTSHYEKSLASRPITSKSYLWPASFGPISRRVGGPPPCNSLWGYVSKTAPQASRAAAAQIRRRFRITTASNRSLPGLRRA